MTVLAKVSKGQIVLPPGIALPEGAKLTIEIEEPSQRRREEPAEDSAAVGHSNNAGSEAPASEGPALSFYERHKEFIGLEGDGPVDGALNHDHYLYGAPKKACA